MYSPLGRSHTSRQYHCSIGRQLRPFVSIWISRFGVPSDRGSQFESLLWKHLMELLGSSRIRTTSYHPMSNGLVERFHRHLKAAIMAQPDPTDWTDCLVLVLLGIRTALKKDLGCTPAEQVYDSTLHLVCLHGGL